jgi:hypothetical protein
MLSRRQCAMRSTVGTKDSPEYELGIRGDWTVMRDERKANPSSVEVCDGSGPIDFYSSHGTALCVSHSVLHPIGYQSNQLRYQPTAGAGSVVHCLAFGHVFEPPVISLTVPVPSADSHPPWRRTRVESFCVSKVAAWCSLSIQSVRHWYQPFRTTFPNLQAPMHSAKFITS